MIKNIINIAVMKKNSITNKCSPFTKEDYYLHLNTIDILKKLGDYEFECQTEKEEVNPESSDCEQIELKKLLIVNFQKMIKKNLYIVVMKKLRMKFLDVVIILKKVMKMN